MRKLKNLKVEMKSSQGNKEIVSLCLQRKKLRSLDIGVEGRNTRDVGQEPSTNRFQVNPVVGREV